MNRIEILSIFRSTFEYESVKSGTRWVPTLHYNDESILLSDISYATEDQAKQCAKDVLKMLGNFSELRL